MKKWPISLLEFYTKVSQIRTTWFRSLKPSTKIHHPIIYQVSSYDEVMKPLSVFSSFRSPWPGWCPPGQTWRWAPSPWVARAPSPPAPASLGDTAPPTECPSIRWSGATTRWVTCDVKNLDEYFRGCFRQILKFFYLTLLAKRSLENRPTVKLDHKSEILSLFWRF